MGVDLGGTDVTVTQQLLYGAQVVALLEQACSEAVPEGVALDVFVDTRGPPGLAEGLAQCGFMQMMAP
jgi:hypothetical protein